MTDNISHTYSGEENELEQLFILFYAPLLAYARKYIDDLSVREDIVQEVFVSMWENRKTLPPVRSARGYLLAAVRNSCLNILKKNGHASRYHEFVLNEASQNGEDELYLSTELHEMLDNVLDRLPEAYRTVFEMHCVDRKHMSDIAEKLGISLRTAKRYKATVVDTLKKRLKKI